MYGDKISFYKLIKRIKDLSLVKDITSEIDKFINNQNIIDVIVESGCYVGGVYRFVKENNEWIFFLSFDEKVLLAFIDRK